MTGPAWLCESQNRGMHKFITSPLVEESNKFKTKDIMSKNCTMSQRAGI